MKILITGASGLLGRALMSEFEGDTSFDVLGLAFSRPKGTLRKVDIRDEDGVRKIMQEFQPDAVIHAAAQRRPDIVERDEEAARTINCSATEIIATISDYAVLRVPILYGQIETIEESAVTTLLNTLVNQDNVDLVDDCCIRCPTHVDDIAVVCRQMCERRTTDPESVSGVFHWCGADFMTKYTMIVTIANAFNLPHGHLRANPVQPAGETPRPKDCSMDRSKLVSLGIGQTTPFTEGIQKVMKPFISKNYS
ncbi:methionine adenosyltransferase 2 subunit beta-like isoform X2 [Lytechinus variegatus]|uniref:methionine adenosyltransferase 2 subunit beta-like isoform X2 n=1 Tax=Lytechinus variegatus TaxID=7654 RepID=UPI001BB2CC47|nr:methionine adenosyltransferase 2 subunit beta-like isoform X2 [Lytechinus variegatus]